MAISICWSRKHNYQPHNLFYVKTAIGPHQFLGAVTRQLTIMRSPLVHEDAPAPLELHTRPINLDGDSGPLSAEYCRRDAVLLETNKAGRCWLPSPIFRLLHNFYHAQHQDRGYILGIITLRQLMDWVKLRQSFDTQINWVYFLRRIEYNKLTCSCSAYALTAQRYFGQAYPAGLLETRGAHRFMRRQRNRIKNRWYRRTYSIGAYFLIGVYRFLTLRSIRATYGDLSVNQCLFIMIKDLASPAWYVHRYQDLKQRWN